MHPAGIEPASRGFWVPTLPLSYRCIWQLRRVGIEPTTTRTVSPRALPFELPSLQGMYRYRSQHMPGVEGDRIWTYPEDLTLLFHRAALRITRRILTLISVGNLSIPRLFRISLSLFAPLQDAFLLIRRLSLRDLLPRKQAFISWTNESNMAVCIFFIYSHQTSIYPSKILSAPQKHSARPLSKYIRIVEK